MYIEWAGGLSTIECLLLKCFGFCRTIKQVLPVQIQNC